MCFQLRFLGYYALCHVLCLDLCFYMLIFLDLHAQGSMFPLFHSSFCFMLMLGLCAHMLGIMYMVMLCSDLVFVCFLPCFMLRSTSVHAYILGFMFYHAYVLAFPCSHTYCHAHAQIYVCLCARIYALRSLCQLSICLCASCHVCMPKPRLCLSCHVLLQPFCRFIFLSCVLAYWFGPDLDPMVFVIIHTLRPT